MFSDLEGGFYGIVDDAGERYDPVNLGDEFKSDGLRIRFEAKILRDYVSVHMWGRLVEILEVERLGWQDGEDTRPCAPGGLGV